MGLLVSHGAKDATTDTGTIRAWWTQEPDANIGIACGPSGLIGVDEDPRNGGDESLARLKLEGFRLPDTIMSKTGGGGHHNLYRRPEGVPVKDSSLGPGVELKIAGLVVAPPSLHASGSRYEWLAGSDPFDGVKVTDAPEWLVRRLLRDPRSRPRQTGSGEGIDWTASCPPSVATAIRQHAQLKQLWEAIEPLNGQVDTSPSTFRFLLQGQLAARGFNRQQVLDASVAFTNLRSTNGVSDSALLNEIDEAFLRAKELRPESPVALRTVGGSSERAVLDAVEHTIREMNGMPDGAKRLLVAMSRYSPDGCEAWCPDVKLAEDLHWPIDDKPKGSRHVRTYKQHLRTAGCVTALTRSAPGKPVKYRLNVREQHPHRRTGLSYE